MGTVTENIVMQAKNETKKALNEMEKDTRKVAGSLEKDLSKGAGSATKRIGELGKGLNSTVQQMTGFNLAQLSAAGAAALVARQVGESIRFFASYAEEVRELSAATGMSNEESSRMIQLFDDANVSTEALTMAARQMVRQGIAPNIDNIAKLADEYNALEDPLEKSKLLMDNFGRSGLEMGKLLEMGSDAIREAGKSAELFGQVLDDEAIAAAEEYRLALDNLSDASEGLKISLGKELVPMLADVANEVNRVVEEHLMATQVTEELDKAVQRGVISQQQMDEMWRRLVQSGGDYNVIAGEMMGIEAAMRDDRRESIGLLQAQKTAQEGLTGATEDATGVYNEAIGALREQNLTEAQRLSIETQLKLLSGELTQADIRRSQTVQQLSNQYAQGNLTMEQYLGALQSLGAGLDSDAAKALALARSIDKIKSKSVTVTVNYRNTYATEGGTRPGAGRQHGGPVLGGNQYLVGEKGPEILLMPPGTSGYVVPNEKIGGGSNKSAGGNLYIGKLIIYAAEGMDEFDLADAVATRIAEQARAAEKAGLGFAG